MSKILNRIQEKPIIWILPIIIFLMLFYFYPMFEVFRLSFTDATLVSATSNYTIENYKEILSNKDFYDILGITFMFVIGSIFFQILLGLVIALLVNRGMRRNLIGAVVTRTVVLSCWIIPGISIGIVWKIMLSEFNYGIVNYLLNTILGIQLPFLTSTFYALVSVVIANIWCGTAFSMLILFSGLQRIPDYLYEAARVDGASPVQQFLYITLPKLKSFIFINMTLATIYTFNTFGLILSLTGGGPGGATRVLSLHVYRTVFDNLNVGKGCAYAVILLLINLIISVVYYYFFIGDVDETDMG